MRRFFLAAGAALVILFSFSCNSKDAKQESDTALFKDYKGLEDALTLVPRFPNREFSERYKGFLTTHGWSNDLSGLPDGSYEAYSIIDVRDYVHYIRFEMKGGRAVAVYYDEFKPSDDKGKRNDVAYGKSMTALTGQITPAQAYPVLERRFLEVQDPLKVDTVTGATLSSYRFQIVALKALYEFRAKRALNKTIYDWKGKPKEIIVDDEDAGLIKKTVLNYVEGWYEANGERMAEALHPKLAKRGMSAANEIYDVSRDWMIDATGKGQGRISEPATGKKEITILDRTAKIATVKLVSNQFDDYLHLLKIDGEWKIINALWNYR